MTVVAAIACGDVSKVSVGLSFPDEATETATKKLLFIVREAPSNNQNGCASLWSTDGSALPQNQSSINYPYKNDVVAAPIDLAQYPRLTLFIYAFPSEDLSNPAARALAGGCQQLESAESAGEVVITLERRPGTKS
jgi:hypothetical protein